MHHRIQHLVTNTRSSSALGPERTQNQNQRGVEHRITSVAQLQSVMSKTQKNFDGQLQPIPTITSIQIDGSVAGNHRSRSDLIKQLNTQPGDGRTLPLHMSQVLLGAQQEQLAKRASIQHQKSSKHQNVRTLKAAMTQQFNQSQQKQRRTISISMQQLGLNNDQTKNTQENGDQISTLRKEPLQAQQKSNIPMAPKVSVERKNRNSLGVASRSMPHFEPIQAQEVDDAGSLRPVSWLLTPAAISSYVQGNTRRASAGPESRKGDAIFNGDTVNLQFKTMPDVLSEQVKSVMNQQRENLHKRCSFDPEMKVQRAEYSISKKFLKPMVVKPRASKDKRKSSAEAEHVSSVEDQIQNVELTPDTKLSDDVSITEDHQTVKLKQYFATPDIQKEIKMTGFDEMENKSGTINPHKSLIFPRQKLSKDKPNILQLDHEEYAMRFASAQQRNQHKMQEHVSLDTRNFKRWSRVQTAKEVHKGVSVSQHPISMKTTSVTANYAGCKVNGQRLVTLCQPSDPLNEHIMAVDRERNDFKILQLKKKKNALMMQQNFAMLASSRKPFFQGKQRAVSSKNKGDKKLLHYSEKSIMLAAEKTKNLQNTLVIMNSRSVKLIDQVQSSHGAVRSGTSMRTMDGFGQTFVGNQRKMTKEQQTASIESLSRLKSEKTLVQEGAKQSYWRQQKSNKKSRGILKHNNQAESCFYKTEDGKSNGRGIKQLIQAEPKLFNASTPNGLMLGSCTKSQLKLTSLTSCKLQESSNEEPGEHCLIVLTKAEDDLESEIELVDEKKEDQEVKNAGQLRKQIKIDQRRQVEADLAKTYGSLVPLKMCAEPMVKHGNELHIETLVILNQVTFSVVGVNDRLLFKMLRGNDAEDDMKKGIDFYALRRLLYTKLKESPDDPCLLHNKAVLYAYKHYNEESIQLFEQLGMSSEATKVLEPGWQMNWAIVLLRQGNYYGLFSMLKNLPQGVLQQIEDFQALMMHSESMITLGMEQSKAQSATLQEQQPDDENASMGEISSDTEGVKVDESRSAAGEEQKAKKIHHMKTEDWKHLDDKLEYQVDAAQSVLDRRSSEILSSCPADSQRQSGRIPLEKYKQTSSNSVDYTDELNVQLETEHLQTGSQSERALGTEGQDLIKQMANVVEPNIFSGQKLQIHQNSSKEFASFPEPNFASVPQAQQEAVDQSNHRPSAQQPNKPRPKWYPTPKHRKGSQHKLGSKKDLTSPNVVKTQLKIHRKTAQYYRDLVQPLSPPSQNEFSTSQNSQYNYPGVYKGRRMERSESNIYLEPKSQRKKRRFKKVHYATNKRIHYQEINSSDVSMGPVLLSLPSESQTTSKMSYDQRSPEGSSPMINVIKSATSGKESQQIHPLLQHSLSKPMSIMEDLDVVHEMNEADKSFMSSPMLTIDLKEKNCPNSGIATDSNPRKKSLALDRNQKLQAENQATTIVTFQGDFVTQQTPGTAIAQTMPKQRGREMTFGKLKGVKLTEVQKTADWEQEVNLSNVHESGARSGQSREDAELASDQVKNLAFTQSSQGASEEGGLRLQVNQSQDDINKPQKKKLGQSKSMANNEFRKFQSTEPKDYKNINLYQNPNVLGQFGTHGIEAEAKDDDDSESKKKTKTMKNINYVVFKEAGVYKSQRDLTKENPFAKLIQAASAIALEKKSMKTVSNADKSDLGVTSECGNTINVSALGKQAIKAVGMLRDKQRDDGKGGTSVQRRESDDISKGPSARSKNPLSEMITKWFTDVERFRMTIGGSKFLTVFIKKLSEEGGTGEIYAMESKKKNQRRRQKADKIPRQSGVIEMTAYEKATGIYAEHLHTIYFLLDLYDKKKKAFRRLLNSIDHDEKERNLEEELSAQARSAKQHSKHLSASQLSQTQRSSSSQEVSDFNSVGQLQDMGSVERRKRKKANAPDKYKIMSTVSELALSVLKSMKRLDLGSDENTVNNKQGTETVHDHDSVPSCWLTDKSPLSGAKQDHQAISWWGPQQQKPPGVRVMTAHTGNKKDEQRHGGQESLFVCGEDGTNVKHLLTGRVAATVDRPIENDFSWAVTNHQDSTPDKVGQQCIKIERFETTEKVTEAEMSFRPSTTQQQEKCVKFEEVEEDEKEEVQESFGTDPLTWEPNFKESEIVKMLDLDNNQEGFSNVLDLLGETRAKVRAERLLTLIEEKKIAWYKVDEPVLHEVMGIEKSQHRRMKLIMAKLGSKKPPVAGQSRAKKAESSSNDKKISFLARTAAGASNEAFTVAKLEKFKKYYKLSRPNAIEETYEQAERLATEKTLAELQRIVIERLKRKAQKKDSQAFINDMVAKEKTWQAERDNYQQRQRTTPGSAVQRDTSLLTGSEQAEEEESEASVDLSDIKSENESIYWEQKRGNIEDVDILITQQNLFDDKFYKEFNEGLRLLQQCVEAPGRTIQELMRAQDSLNIRGRKPNKQLSGHN